MANENKGTKVADLKARLKLKADTTPSVGGPPGLQLPLPPGGAPLVPPPGGGTPAPFPAVSPPLVPPPGAPLVPPPGAAPLVPPPGVSLPQPPTAQAPAPTQPAEPEVEYYDPHAGMFVVDDDEREAKPDLSKSLWWVKFAAPSIVVGLLVGGFWGYGSFTRDYNASRRQQLAPIQESFNALSAKMEEILPKVESLKESSEGAPDVKTPKEAEALTADLELMSADALKTFSATFLQANTLRLLYQYQFLTDQFVKSLKDHAKRVEATKEELLAAKAGNLPNPRYAVVLLDNTDQGGVITGSVVTMLGDPKIEKKKETITEEPAEEGGQPKTREVEVTYKTYQLKASPDGEVFERVDKIMEGGKDDIREIVNPDVIPSYAESLLADHDERVKNLKAFAKMIRKVQEELKTALAADIGRQVEFDF